MEMEDRKPKSVKSVGLIVAILSGFIVISNGMGILAFSIIGVRDQLSSSTESKGFNLPAFLFENYIAMCFIIITIGILCFLGGLNIRRYKLWANRLVTCISLILIIIIWVIMMSLSAIISGSQGLELYRVGIIANGVIWSTPIGLLIWFLNRKKIKKHFV